VAEEFIIFDQTLPEVEGEFCGACPQRFIGQKRVLPDGNGTSGIMLVGDSPWKDEVRQGRPFAGAAGQFLEKHIFRRLGVKRQDFILANSMWCKPPHLNWTDRGGPEVAEALMHCRPYLDQLIERVQPKVIIAMGNVAMRRLVGVDGIMKRQAYVHDSRYGIPVIPTLHPSFLMQDNHKYTPAMYFAFRRAQEIVETGRFVRMDTAYCLDAPLPELEKFMEEYGYSPDFPLAVDIETPESDKIPEDKREPMDDDEEEDDLEEKPEISQTIIRCGFSWREGVAVSFPWTEPYISFLKAILAKQRVVVFHNKNFDLPRLEKEGLFVAGRIYDTMWMWHFLQSDLPKSLEFVAPFYTDLAPWKHLSAGEPARYNAIDNDATIRLFYKLKFWLESQRRWERFELHCVEADRILTRMGKKGIMVDRNARTKMQEALKDEVDSLDGRIQATIPNSILPRKVLKTDRTIKGLDPEELAKWESYETACDCSLQPDKTLSTPSPKCRRCKGTGTTTYWRYALTFNWQSTDQTKALARSKGLKIPMKRGENREALESKTLKQFGKRHPVFLDILHARQRRKLITTYNWPLDQEQRAHTTYGFHPSTWRKSSRSVNLQNIPKRNDLAEAFRRTLVAAPGHTLAAGDSAAIEAVLVGYAAGSERFIKLAKAGVHDFFMSHVRAHKEGGRGIDIILPYPELVQACAAAKKLDKSYPLDQQLRESCKRCIHGTHYGMTPYGMRDEYPEEFPTQKVATELQEMYLSMFPEIREWMRTTRERVSVQTFLDNHYQYRHYFFSVFKWDFTYERWVLGKDGKRCIAFGPQSDGSAIQTEDLLTLDAMEGLADWLRLIIHDEIVLEVPDSQVPYACQALYNVQSRPRPELGGLTIGSEVKYGPNLADMEVWHPPLIIN
jgi:DNA polymerase